LTPFATSFGVVKGLLCYASPAGDVERGLIAL
jgi:hypothetical protein